jgi:iron(III) transport system substrate-binding protein
MSPFKLRAPNAFIPHLAVALAIILVACGGDSRRKVIVYSPHGKDLLLYYEQEFEKANPTIDVQWMDMGSQAVLERLRAETVNPQADIWFGAPAEAFQRAAREGLLEPYSPTWAAAVDEQAKDAANHWYGTYLTPEVIAFNSEVVPRDSAPKDWDDVLDPKWRGKILIRDPIAAGTMRAIFGAIISRSLRETGSQEAGYEWLRKLDANTKEYVTEPVFLYQKLSRQEGVITLWNMPDIALQKSRNNLPIDYIFPASGTPLLVDAIALVKGGRDPDAARMYYEFVTSAEAMYEASSQFLRLPARRDLDNARLPDWVQQTMSELKPMPLDAALLAEKLDEWMTYWDSYIRNSSRRQ